MARSAQSNQPGSLKDPDVLLELVSRIAEGIYITNHNGDFVDGNPALLQILGFNSIEALRRSRVEDVADPEMRAEQLKLLVRDGSVRDFELMIRRPDGEVRWVLDSAYAVRNPFSGEVTYRGIIRDITVRKRLEGQLLEQSVRDPLTGAFNRRRLPEFERQAGDQPWGALAFDIDHFKHYNDTHGHHAGDMVLVRMVKFLNRYVRADSSIIRMGGDEFLVLLPNSTPEITERAAERIQQAASKEAPTPFSMGTATRAEGESLEKTINRADQHLYEVRTFLRTPNQERRKPI